MYSVLPSLWPNMVGEETEELGLSEMPKTMAQPAFLSTLHSPSSPSLLPDPQATPNRVLNNTADMFTILPHQNMCALFSQVLGDNVL